MSAIDDLIKSAQIQYGDDKPEETGKMNIEIKGRVDEKEYTWLGVIHANNTASQIKVNQDTSVELISDILEVFSKHLYSGPTRIVLLYVAHGFKFECEVATATFNENATPEDYAGLLKNEYGETGVQVIDYTTYSQYYQDGEGLGVDSSLVYRCIRDIIRQSKPVRTQVDIPEFMLRK